MVTVAVVTVAVVTVAVVTVAYCSDLIVENSSPWMVKRFDCNVALYYRNCRGTTRSVPCQLLIDRKPDRHRTSE